MDNATGSAEGTSAVDKEDVRLGYQIAVELLTYQGQLNWNRFNVMLVANSVLIAATGLAFSIQDPVPLFLGIALPALGLFLCAVWMFLTARGFVYHSYWGMKAKRLEQTHLRPIVTTLAEARSSDPERSASPRTKMKALWARIRGAPFDARNQGEPGEIEFSWLSEPFRLITSQRYGAYAVIVVFILLYIAFLVGILVWWKA